MPPDDTLSIYILFISFYFIAGKIVFNVNPPETVKARLSGKKKTKSVPIPYLLIINLGPWDDKSAETKNEEKLKTENLGKFHLSPESAKKRGGRGQPFWTSPKSI